MVVLEMGISSRLEKPKHSNVLASPQTLILVLTQILSSISNPTEHFH